MGFFTFAGMFAIGIPLGGMSASLMKPLGLGQVQGLAYMQDTWQREFI